MIYFRNFAIYMNSNDIATNMIPFTETRFQ